MATCGAWEGEVVDASMSGMAIVHQGPGAASGDIVEVDLRYGVYSFKLPAEVVWDRVLEGQGKTTPAPHRCGLAFRRLGKREHSWLEHFLWSQTEGWPEIPIPDALA
jgi:hypothetical protein